MLFTKPSCCITFYSNYQEVAAANFWCDGQERPPIMFAIALHSQVCSRGKAAKQWDKLEESVAPLLQQTCFKLLALARRLLPQALGAEPCLFPANVATTDLASQEFPSLWQRLALEAYRCDDVWLAIWYYSRCLDALQGDEDQNVATALSNRSACLIKVAHYGLALEDARRSAGLKPQWAKAWNRVGLAATLRNCGGEEAAGELVGEAFAAFLKAVELEPTAAHVAQLHRGAEKQCTAGFDEAHAAKEDGNRSMRVKEWSQAIAAYTLGIARLPKKSDQQG